MSDLSAAAAALGVPEPIVQRSAAARAAETGMSVDEVLAAWAGGSSVAGAPPAAPPTSTAEEAPEPVPSAEGQPAAEMGPAPAPVFEPVAAAAPAATTTVSGKPPVLVGKVDNPMTVFFGALGLFLAVFLVGLVGPVLPLDEPGARTSDLPYSETAVRGRDIYASVGCGACHTQMVRPIVSDVGLGGVTLNDSNQVLGTRRFGPDLSDAGTRLSSSQVEAIITGLGAHPTLQLSSGDLESLVAYIVESKTSTETGGPTEGEG